MISEAQEKAFEPIYRRNSQKRLISSINNIIIDRYPKTRRTQHVRRNCKKTLFLIIVPYSILLD